MPPVGIEPTVPTGERPQAHALDRAATGTGTVSWYVLHNKRQVVSVDKKTRW